MTQHSLSHVLFRVTFASLHETLPALRALARLVEPPLAALLPEDGMVTLLVAGGAGRGGAVMVVLENLGLTVTRTPPQPVTLRPVQNLLSEQLARTTASSAA